MMKTPTILAALGATALLAGCLDDPQVKDCLDFPLNTVDTCPSGCEIYCERLISTCPGQSVSLGECITDCGTEPVNPTMTDGQPGERSNNTLSCRLTYLLEGDCMNASLTDSAMCVGADCNEYCTTMDADCPGAYSSVSDCEDLCDLLPRGDPNEDANTVECRFRYAQQASTDAEACRAASFNGGGVCGDDICVPYCSVVQRHCTGANQVYEDEAECMRQCAYLDPGTYDDWQSGGADSIQCRTWHGGLPALNGPMTHCPHTQVYNSEQCPSIGQPPPAGWPCQTFCDIVIRNCPGTFTDVDACLPECQALPEMQQADPNLGPDVFPVSTDTCPTF